MNGKGAAQTSGRKEEPHPCGPPPPHGQAGRRGSGAQRMRMAPAQVPSRPGGAAARDPAPETSPPRPRPSAGAWGGPRRQRRRPWGTLGERPRHTRSSALSGPSPAPSGAANLQERRATSPQVDPAKARVCEGAGARWQGGGGDSRSSWPRPCHRSAPPAPPAGLSAPVARGPPSSWAGSG